MKNTGWIAVTILVMSTLVFSQDWTGQGRQTGYVFDEEGNPLEEVRVKLLFVKTQSGFETKTDKKGKWVAFGIKGGKWNVDFEKVGYMPKKIWISVLDFRQVNPVVEVKLQKMEGLVLTDDLREELGKANSIFDEGRFEEAKSIYEGIIEKYPDAHIINLSIGNCYFQLEMYDRAEEFYKKVLEKDAKNSSALMGIGNCCSNQGDSDRALEWYTKIEFEKIKDPVVLYNIGTTFYNNSRHEEALKYYKRAVEIKEDFLDARYQLGLAYLARGEYAEALIEFEFYLEHDPDSERASQVKGFIEFLKKKINEEKEFL